MIEIQKGQTQRPGAVGKIMSGDIHDPNQNLIEIANYMD